MDLDFTREELDFRQEDSRKNDGALDCFFSLKSRPYSINNMNAIHFIRIWCLA